MKKRSLFSIISLMMGMIILLTGCTLNVGEEVEVEEQSKTPELDETSEETHIKVNKGLVSFSVPYEPVAFKAMVEPYKVEANFSNIENLDIFGDFSKDQIGRASCRERV